MRDANRREIGMGDKLRDGAGDAERIFSEFYISSISHLQIALVRYADNVNRTNK